MKETTRKTFCAIADKHRFTPFTLTPGRRAVLPQFNESRNDFYMSPVVVLAEQDGHLLLKFSAGSICATLDEDTDIENVTPHVWARCLWNLTTNQRKAAA